jgi:hypothetical protein
LDNAGATGGDCDIVGKKKVCEHGDCTAYISRHSSLLRIG